MNISRIYPVYDRWGNVLGQVRRNAYVKAKALVGHSVCWTERGSQGRGWIDSRAVFRQKCQIGTPA